MSSILDALNKLEQEKAQVEQEDDFDREIDPQQAARELIGGGGRGSAALRLTPAAMLLGAVLFMSVMIAVSVAVTVLILNRAAPVTNVEVASTPAALEAPLPIDLNPQPNPEPQIAAVIATPTPEPEPVAPEAEREVIAEVVEPEPRPIAVAKIPEPRPVEAAEPVIEAPAPEPAPVIAQRVEPEPVPEPEVEVEEAFVPSPAPIREAEPHVAEIRQLPPLTLAIQQRYGAEPILINMISPASPNRPYAYAIINRIKVGVGDSIGDSRLKLVQVENHGIAVEAAGQKYYVPF